MARRCNAVSADLHASYPAASDFVRVAALLHPTLCALLPFCIRCFVLFLPMLQTICANEASLEACANCTEAGEW